MTTSVNRHQEAPPLPCQVNGVAAIHTEIIKKAVPRLSRRSGRTSAVRKETFPEFYKYCCDSGKPAKPLDLGAAYMPQACRSRKETSSLFYSFVQQAA